LRIWGQGVFDGCCELSDSSPEEDQEELRSPVAQGGEHDYDRAFAKAEHVLSLFLTDGRPREEPPGAILAELFPSAMGEAPPASENRAAIPALIRWLTKRSHKVRYSNPDEMLHWGLMGRLAADSCSAEVAGNRYRLADIRAWAWGQFGNSLRVCGRISESEEAFEAAQRYTASGTGDPVLRARLNEQITALCIFQRRFEDALELDAGAAGIYHDLGDWHRFARVSVQEAIILTYSGESDRAATVLKRAIPLIKSDMDPHLAAAARHNLVHCYIDAKRPDLAKLAYFQTRELREGLDDGLILLRTRWQEGQLLRSLGHLEAAERALLSAQEGFMEQGLSFEVAVVSHDLAGVLRQMGETKRLEQITLEISTRIQALHTSREALASLQDLRTSLRLSSPSVPASR
jgi:tetratricopeptide (TPR) repeat protein